MINLFAPINHLGTGVHAYNLMRQFEILYKEEICLIPPFGSVQWSNDITQRWYLNRERFSQKNTSLMIFDVSFLAQFSGSPRVGFAVFETDKLNHIQLAAVKSCDVVLTPSLWGQEVLKSHDIESHIVNEGYDPEVYKISEGPADSEMPTFIHVGKFEERKGTMQVLECFFKALENEDAALIMACDNPFNNQWAPTLMDWFRDRNFNPRVGESGDLFPLNWRRDGLHIDLVLSRGASFTKLYQKADCGIFPSKGEGWGLPILECMASGTPVIAGSWSGQSEYVKDSIFTLRKSKLKLARDDQWFRGDKGNWYVPDDQEIIDLIKYAHEYARSYRKGEEWQRQLSRVRNFTWEASCRALRKII